MLKASTTVKSGFTVAELLIALGLLGVVVAITLPTILTMTGELQKKAVMKEGVGEVSKLITAAYLSGNAVPHQSDQLIRQNITYLRERPSSIATDGNPTYTFDLENGATLGYHVGNLEEFSIDYNGPQPPNNQLKDSLIFFANLSPTAVCGMKPGSVGMPDPSLCPAIGGPTNPNPTQSYVDFFNQMMLN